VVAEELEDLARKGWVAQLLYGEPEKQWENFLRKRRESRQAQRAARSCDRLAAKGRSASLQIGEIVILRSRCALCNVMNKRMRQPTSGKARFRGKLPARSGYAPLSALQPEFHIRTQLLIYKSTDKQNPLRSPVARSAEAFRCYGHSEAGQSRVSQIAALR
jgi:hypothetical protein